MNSKRSDVIIETYKNNIHTTYFLILQMVLKQSYRVILKFNFLNFHLRKIDDTFFFI